MSTDTPGARVAPVSISPKVFERYRSPVVDGNPVVVVGGKDGKSENDERPPSDEERARATLCDRAEERQFVERRRFHGAIIAIASGISDVPKRGRDP
jgi:hypothetical protein